MAQHVLRLASAPSIDSHFESAKEILSYWLERSRTRRRLAALEDHRLEDIGISREQAAAESSKYFWQH